MSEKEKYIRDRISYWRYILGLENWNIKYRIVDKLQIESSCANIIIEWEKEEAVIEICEKYDDSEIELAILHEIIHLYIHYPMLFVTDILSKFCENAKTRQVLQNELDSKEEIIVGRLAKAFLKLQNIKGENRGKDS